MSNKGKHFCIVGKPMPRHKAWKKVLGNTSCDIGQALNKFNVEGQIEGAFMNSIMV